MMATYNSMRSMPGAEPAADALQLGVPTRFSAFDGEIAFDESILSVVLPLQGYLTVEGLDMELSARMVALEAQLKGSLAAKRP